MPPANEPKVYRLTDILTQEVSLVDRAANKRMFLLTKRDDGKGGTELVPDGKGGFVPAKKADGIEVDPGTKKPENDPKPADKDPAAPPPPADAPPAIAMTKATLEGLASAIEKLSALAQASKAKAAAETDSAEVERLLGEAIGSIGVVRDATQPAWIEGVLKIDRKELAKAVGSASEKLKSIAESCAIDTSGAPTPDELRWKIYDVLGALVQLSQFDIAQAAIEKIEKADKATSEALAYRSIVEGLEKALSPMFEPALEGVVSESHAAHVLSVAQGVLEAQSQEIISLRKRLQTLESEPRQSQAIPVEKQKRSADKGDEVVWPMDMADDKRFDDDDYNFSR